MEIEAFLLDRWGRQFPVQCLYVAKRLYCIVSHETLILKQLLVIRADYVTVIHLYIFLLASETKLQVKLRVSVCSHLYPIQTMCLWPPC